MEEGNKNIKTYLVPCYLQGFLCLLDGKDDNTPLHWVYNVLILLTVSDTTVC